LNAKLWIVVGRAVVVRRRTKRRVLRVRIGSKKRKFVEPAESRWFKFKLRRLLRTKYVTFDPSWCNKCRGWRDKKSCVRLVRQFNPHLLTGLDKPCFAPRKRCRFCERDLHSFSNETARNHYRWCLQEEPGIYIPGMKAYQMFYIPGKEARIKFGQLYKDKKVFKSGGKWYRKAGT